MDIKIFYILAGIILLFFGRKMIWFALGCVGFVAGFSAAGSVIHEGPFWLPLVAGGLAAIILVGLVKTVKNIAFGLGGFIIGAYIAYNLLDLLKFHPGLLQYAIYIAGGVIFAALLLSLFDGALIIVSAVLGSMLIVQNITVPVIGRNTLFFLLAGFGLLMQLAISRGKHRSNPSV